MVAQSVCEEVAVWLGSPLPARWVPELTAHARTIYAHNERFRRRIRGAGNCGRDHLWMFMRHWLAALLKDRRPHFYARLPVAYRTGGDLPDRPPMADEQIAFRQFRPPPTPCFLWDAGAGD